MGVVIFSGGSEIRPTLPRHGPEARPVLVREYGRPRCDMNLLMLMQGVILQQGLDMFPAGQGSHASDRRVDDVGEARPGGVPEDGPLHMRRLHLPPHHLNGPVRTDGACGDIQRVVVVLGEAKGHGDFVAGRARADGVHLGRVASERVHDVAIREFEIDGARPTIQFKPSMMELESELELHPEHLAFDITIPPRFFEPDEKAENAPYVGRVARYKTLRKRYQFCPVGGRLIDQPARLLHRRSEIQPCRLGLSDGDTDFSGSGR